MSGWRYDPGWSELSSSHALRPLDAEESRSLLPRHGIGAEAGAALARVGRGHPLALVLLAEASVDATSIAGFADAPGVVVALMTRA